MVHNEDGMGVDAYRFKISDFGLAIKEDDAEAPHKRCGTPGYVPPEILTADAKDVRRFATKKWDTFSVGSILYMLISRPFLQSRPQSFSSRYSERDSDKYC